MATELSPKTELEADLRLFEEMFAAKARFYDQIVESRAPGAVVDVRDLRQEYIYEIAEFYYLLSAFGVNNATKLRNFAESHNRNVEELLDNKSQLEKLGVQAQRLRDARFETDEKMDRLVHNCGRNAIRLSQTDLARFLVEYMSPESCRTSVKILGDAGFLKLSKSPYGAILIESTGKLEQIYGDYIRSFRKGIM